MGVYIPNMEMPKTCCACFCARDNECGITRYEPTFEEWYENGVKDCPLVPVPPHGRLIDGDVAEAIHFTSEDADGKDFYDGILFAADFISQQPTIIKAEEGET